MSVSNDLLSRVYHEQDVIIILNKCPYFLERFGPIFFIETEMLIFYLNSKAGGGAEGIAATLFCLLVFGDGF